MVLVSTDGILPPARVTGADDFGDMVHRAPFIVRRPVHTYNTSGSGPAAALAVKPDAAAGNRTFSFLRQQVFVLQVQYSGKNIESGFCVSLCRPLLTATVLTGHGNHSTGSWVAV
jgi:hypothetical protein